MGLHRALRTLVDTWDDLRTRLDEQRFAELTEHVEAYTRAALPDDQAAAGEEIALLLSDALDRDHPFRMALGETEHRLAGNLFGDPARLRESLELGAALRALLPDPPPTMAEVAAGATAWLLAADAVEDTALDPALDPADLIRLERADGAGQWPAFQFDADGAPLDTVRAVNRVLGSADDPWGAADWWLGAHAWLPAPPADLLGEVDAQLLIDVANGERAEA
ncbi:hypothetical protein [Actinokineospora iranica]|uniref:Uncharacterized protein n=1 Tax=Actinokineospora iranica TaxID=1271860 RepID=A0A1G6QB71_9PSEU|nr:hypothetical protein [Actinokineospora iranica]SDC89558.1 hypothetical protein SAMN05216174_105189 [Actinokineospora iranica]